MDLLPNEILEHILCSSMLDVCDVVNFSSTCWKLRNVVANSSTLWKQKFVQKWKKPLCKHISIRNWREEFIIRMKSERETMKTLLEMSPKFYHFGELCGTDLKYVNSLVDSSQNSYYYVMSYLFTLTSFEVITSLTIQYYAFILIRYFKQRHLMNSWQEMINFNKCDTVERGAIFLADWINLTYESVCDTVTNHLDYAADLVRKTVKEQFESHPLNQISKETLLKWRNENIAGNMFEPKHCKTIIQTVSIVLSKKLQYTLSEDIEPEFQFNIDYAVTERMVVPEIFSVIYESVARRVGVKCEIVFSGSLCFLRWTEDYSNADSAYHYIDTSGINAFLKLDWNSRNCSALTELPIQKKIFKCCDMQQIAMKIASDVNYSLEQEHMWTNHLCRKQMIKLFLLFSPTCMMRMYPNLCRNIGEERRDYSGIIEMMKTVDLETLSKESRWEYEFYMSRLLHYQLQWRPKSAVFGAMAVDLRLGLKLNCRNAVEPLQNLRGEMSNTIRKRTEKIKFAVGIIVWSKHHRQMGIVHGWDPQQMSHSPTRTADLLEEKLQEPFYLVLSEDATQTGYWRQDGLQILHSPPAIYHPRIGQYFEEYCITHYRPNKELRDEYPEDAKALQNLLERRSCET